MTSPMGLAERRATKDFQEKALPSGRAELHQLAGKAIVEIVERAL